MIHHLGKFLWPLILVEGIDVGIIQHKAIHRRQVLRVTYKGRCCDFHRIWGIRRLGEINNEDFEKIDKECTMKRAYSASFDNQVVKG